jgi:hypothetical protein
VDHGVLDGRVQVIITLMKISFGYMPSIISHRLRSLCPY